jgi:hypothetical protein
LKNSYADLIPMLCSVLLRLITGSKQRASVNILLPIAAALWQLQPFMGFVSQS